MFGVFTAIDILSLTLVNARELEFDTYSMISAGMTETEVLSRAGEPDKQIRSGKATFHYISIDDSEKGEWTTTVTFAFGTSRVINVSRTRR
jgi:hypothetical protein